MLQISHLSAAEQAQALNGPVNQAIVDTARFLKSRAKCLRREPISSVRY